VAGYSQRSLSQKLGIKPGIPIVALGAPKTYSDLLGPLPQGTTLHSRLPAATSFIHRFVQRQDELRSDITRLATALIDDGILWISWPKKTSGVATDLDENVIREIGLSQGLVDVKVCAVDEVWSGLKFVRRVENRKPLR
jgi:hypothetical protein